MLSFEMCWYCCLLGEGRPGAAEGYIVLSTGGAIIAVVATVVVVFIPAPAGSLVAFILAL